MKPQIAAATFASIIGLYGMTPAVAEPFQERGTDWTTVGSPSPTTAYQSKPQTLPPSGSFASSWGSGRTPSYYEGSSSSSTRYSIGQSCDLTPRIGFNEENKFPTC